MALRYAYNTNGMVHHRLEDAFALLAEAGYDGVGLTLDIHHLDPFAADFAGERRRVARRLRELGLGCVVESGANYLLDPRAKHEPTLICNDPAARARRLNLLMRALEVAAETGAEAMTFWSGTLRPGTDPAEARARLVEGVAQVVHRAHELGTVASLEPEPEMMVNTVAGWESLAREVPGLRLSLDTGHCLVTQDCDPAQAARHHAAELGTVHVEDMKRGVHAHLPFGEGDMDMPAILGALSDTGYDRLVCVELSRDSYRAHTMIRDSLRWLRGCEASLQQRASAA
ncbi:sugar phosphate isomerase/epimerase family protein [Roseomonas elaeocarpi]|uniref:Sugar phosphate isomerase/epimerase family protein n=1 Tax=Roseomonas elaeocarpi TaxID=907779 RepID=A0ABV6JZW7_9PROT